MAEAFREYDISNDQSRFQAIALTILREKVPPNDRAYAWCLMLAEIPGIQNAMQYHSSLAKTEHQLPIQFGSHGESIIRHGGIMLVDVNENPVLVLRTREVTAGTFDGCVDLTLSRTLPDGRDVQIGLLYALDPFSKDMFGYIGRFRGFDIATYDQEGDYQERVLFEAGKVSSLKSSTDSFVAFADFTVGSAAPELSKLLLDFLDVRKPFDIKSSLQHSR